MLFKYLLLYRFKKTGELAHLARALDWQSKGDGFDPRILHIFHEKPFYWKGFLYLKRRKSLVIEDCYQSLDASYSLFIVCFKFKI